MYLPKKNGQFTRMISLLDPQYKRHENNENINIKLYINDTLITLLEKIKNNYISHFDTISNPVEVFGPAPTPPNNTNNNNNNDVNNFGPAPLPPSTNVKHTKGGSRKRNCKSRQSKKSRMCKRKRKSQNNNSRLKRRTQRK